MQIVQNTINKKKKGDILKQNLDNFVGYLTYIINCCLDIKICWWFWANVLNLPMLFRVLLELIFQLCDLWNFSTPSIFSTPSTDQRIFYYFPCACKK